MDELTIKQDDLPDNIKDISKFILVGREKLKSVRAEITAIDKLDLAKEVREQKKEEAQMLSEALIDAEVRVGELLKQIPKVKNQYDKCNSQCCEEQKVTKGKIISNLGFTKDQASRFETLADNKDLVEQVKAEARENDDIPTRTDVLRLAKMRNEQLKREESYGDLCVQLDREQKVFNRYSDVICNVLTLEINQDNIDYWLKDQLPDVRRDMINNLDSAIEKLKEIKNYAHDFNIVKVVK